jgi:hypothetical protein
MLIALWPCYFYPSAPQCTFSPTAFKHYLQLPSVITEHTVHLAISLTDDMVIRFPSCPHQVKDECLDYFSAKIMIPCPPKSPSVPVQCATPVVYFSKAPTLTRALLHQRFAHCGDDVLDTMCRKQTVQGLPKRPPPRYDFDCAICSLRKMTREIKGKTCDTAALSWRFIAYGFRFLGRFISSRFHCHAYHHRCQDSHSLVILYFQQETSDSHRSLVLQTTSSRATHTRYCSC